MKYLMMFLLIICFACDDENEVDFSTTGKVFFQFEYVNHAWQYQHNGFIIDQSGKIYDYEQPEGWNWAEKEQISLEDFLANLNQAEARQTTVESTTLNEMIGLLASVRSGELTEQNFVMADAGAEIYAVYIANEDNTELTRYLLQQRGDIYQKNDSQAAEQITNWLIGIRGEEGFSNENF